MLLGFAAEKFLLANETKRYCFLLSSYLVKFFESTICDSRHGNMDAVLLSLDAIAGN